MMHGLAITYAVLLAAKRSNIAKIFAMGKCGTDKIKKFIFIFHHIVKQTSEYFYFVKTSTILASPYT